MNTYLVYLNWPEACFRASAVDIAALRDMVPAGSRVIRVESDAGFLRALPTATHVITWHFRSKWFKTARRLKVLATPGAGRELVPIAGPDGVIIHFGGYHGVIMAESVAGFILSWAHGFFRPERKLGWGRTAMGGCCRRVAGTRAVILGYGRVGKAIGAKLEALGVSVTGFGHSFDPKAKAVRDVLAEADWFVMALPSDTGTDDMLDADLISRLPSRCVVVNVGRGNAVDEGALLKALREGRIAGAYLDVFKGEPGPLKKKALGRTAGEILALSNRRLPWNLVKMPHMAAFCGDYVRMAFRELKDAGLF